MVLKIDDWIFQVDLEKTAEHSSYVSSEHCTCSYCENYYRTAPKTCPDLKRFLAQFGWIVDATPLEVSEVTMPDEFDKIFAAYNEIQKEQGLNGSAAVFHQWQRHNRRHRGA